MKKLSVFSIVKNEEQMIEGMLKSAEEADEHIILDTGSTDRTIEICEKYTDKIYTDYKWNDDFAEAKNLAMSRCTGDFIIGLDADCRFEDGGIEKLKKEIQTTDKDILSVRLVWNSIDNREKHHHFLPKLFRANAGIKYKGKVHEIPNKTSQGVVDVAIIYLYSPNHYVDTERNLRILLKEDLSVPRNVFYLGREYFDRKMYKEAIETLQKYIKISPWYPEKAEAYLTLAKSYWYTNQGDNAREACLRAIQTNPDFKEALLFMGKIHNSPWKERWQKLSTVATNENVLFIRT